jgi:hypothetical protein
VQPFGPTAPPTQAWPPYGYGAFPPPVAVRNNGFAIASLVCACAGIMFFGVPSILGIIFGFVARSQIRRSQGRQSGQGLALAGIIVGFGVIGLLLLIIVPAVVSSHTHS